MVHDDGGENESVGITGYIKEIKEDAVRVETDAHRSIWLNSRYIIKVKEVR